MFAVVTLTSTFDLGAPGGETTVIEVDEMTVTSSAATSPKRTVAGLENPVPVIVTVVPPAAEPFLGFIFLIVVSSATRWRHSPAWLLHIC